MGVGWGYILSFLSSDCDDGVGQRRIKPRASGRAELRCSIRSLLRASLELTSKPTLIRVPRNQPFSSQMRGMKGQAQDSRAASAQERGSSKGATKDSRRAASSQMRMRGMNSGKTR